MTSKSTPLRKQSTHTNISTERDEREREKEGKKPIQLRVRTEKIDSSMELLIRFIRDEKNSLNSDLRVF